MASQEAQANENVMITEPSLSQSQPMSLPVEGGLPFANDSVIFDLDSDDYQETLPTAPKRRGRPKTKADRSRSSQANLDAKSGTLPERDLHIAAKSSEDSPGLVIARLLGLHLDQTKKGLQVPSVQTLQEPAPLFSTSPLSGQALLRSMALADQSDQDLDKEYLAIAKAFCTAGRFHVSSLVVRASELQMDPQALQVKLWRLMDAQWQFCLIKRLALERQATMSYPRESLILYIDFTSFDETPMKANIKEDAGETVAGTLHPRHVGAIDDVKTTLRLENTIWNRSMPLKLLQTNQRYGMLIKHLAGDNGYLRMCFHVPTPLQACENTTGEVLQQCLLSITGPSRASEEFQLKVRASTHDKAGSNHRAEASIAHSRQWLHWHVDCQAHVIATICKKTFSELVPQDIAGLLHLALSLRQPSALLCFRESLKKVIAKKLLILQGSPPIQSQGYKRACKSLFFSEVSTSLWQHLLLECLPNGDWRNHDAVEFYKDINDDRTKAEISSMLASGLCCALVAHQPKLYATHRWVGCDVAIDELMRLQAIHALLEHTYLEFLSQYPGQRRAQNEHDQGTLPDVEASTDRGEGLQHQQLGLPLEGGQMLQNTAEIEIESTIRAEQHRSANDHSKDRKRSKIFLESCPFGRVVVLRVALAPIMSLMHSQFKVGSQSWEIAQAADLAMNVMEGRQVRRDYGLTMVAEQRLEKQYLAKIRNIFHDKQVWLALPENDINVAMNLKAMVLLCRQAALVQFLLVAEHEKCPFTLFKLLDDSEGHAAEEINALPRCLLDAWSAALLHRYPNIKDPELKEVLQMHCELCSLSVADVESKHSSVRRVTHSRSVQTWGIQLPTLSAEWFGQSLRRTMFSKLFPGTHKTAKLQKQVDVEEASHPKDVDWFAELQKGQKCLVGPLMQDTHFRIGPPGSPRISLRGEV